MGQAQLSTKLTLITGHREGWVCKPFVKHCVIALLTCMDLFQAKPDYYFLFFLVIE